MPSSWSTLPLIEPAVWRDFVNLWQDDEPSMISDLVAEFLSEAERHCGLMREALARGDARKLEFSAHAMKSSSGNLGASRMQEICRMLQDLARDGALSVAQEYFRQFESVLGHTREALAAELAELAS